MSDDSHVLNTLTEACKLLALTDSYLELDEASDSHRLYLVYALETAYFLLIFSIHLLYKLPSEQNLLYTSYTSTLFKWLYIVTRTFIFESARDRRHTCDPALLRIGTALLGIYRCAFSLLSRNLENNISSPFTGCLTRDLAKIG